MSEGDRVIRGILVDHPAFIRGLKRLDPQSRAQAEQALRSLLLLDIAKAPAKLHLHQLTNRKVTSQKGHMVNPFTIHVTSNDRYKASFTFEDGVAYFRVCDEHDIVDKNP